MSLDILQASIAIAIALIGYFSLVFYLNKYILRKNATAPNIATAYGIDLGNNQGFIECTTVHTRLGTSPVFFDSDQWLSEPKNREETTDWLIKTILGLRSRDLSTSEKIDGLAFIEKGSGPTGLIGLQHYIAAKTNMKTCIVKLNRWPFLPQAAIKGEPPKINSNWILISDVSTTGGHLTKASKIFRHSCWAAYTKYAIVLLNRGGQTAISELESNNVKLISSKRIEEEFNKRINEFNERKAA